MVNEKYLEKIDIDNLILSFLGHVDNVKADTIIRDIRILNFLGHEEINNEIINILSIDNPDIDHLLDNIIFKLAESTVNYFKDTLCLILDIELLKNRLDLISILLIGMFRLLSGNKEILLNLVDNLNLNNNINELFSILMCDLSGRLDRSDELMDVMIDYSIDLNSVLKELAKSDTYRQNDDEEEIDTFTIYKDKVLDIIRDLELNKPVYRLFIKFVNSDDYIEYGDKLLLKEFDNLPDIISYHNVKNEIILSIIISINGRENYNQYLIDLLEDIIDDEKLYSDIKNSIINIIQPIDSKLKELNNLIPNYGDKDE